MIVVRGQLMQMTNVIITIMSSVVVVSNSKLWMAIGDIVRAINLRTVDEKCLSTIRVLSGQRENGKREHIQEMAK